MNLMNHYILMKLIWSSCTLSLFENFSLLETAFSKMTSSLPSLDKLRSSIHFCFHKAIIFFLNIFTENYKHSFYCWMKNSCNYNIKKFWFLAKLANFNLITNFSMIYIKNSCSSCKTKWVPLRFKLLWVKHN